MRAGLTIVTMLVALLGWAQQQTSFQYLFNPLPYNPAAAGVFDVFSASAQFRFQSLGLQGAPSNQSITVHSPFSNGQAAAGLQVWNRQIGVQNHFSSYGAFSYRITTGNYKVSFGISGGLDRYLTDFTSLTTRQPDDPVFSQQLNTWSPNFGTGILLKGKRLLAGLSIPSLIVNEEVLDQSRQVVGTFAFLAYERSNGVQLQPNLFYRIGDGQLTEMIFGLNASFREVIGAGVFYSFNNQLATLIHMNITDQLRMAYSYEALLNQSDIAFVGSHEVGIHYLFNLPQKGKASPRYF